MISPQPVILVSQGGSQATNQRSPNVISVSEATNFDTNGTSGLVVASVPYLLNPTSGVSNPAESGNSTQDGLAPQSVGNQVVIAQLFGWNGASFDRIRVANVFKTVVATAAGSTVVWTPTAGKSFRLMGYTISVAGTLAATGVQALQFLDGATAIKNYFADVIQTPTVSISGGDTQIGADLGQGQLSAAVNNVLSISLGSAMVTGGVAVNAWGTEE
jgi:hypothetical protein